MRFPQQLLCWLVLLVLPVFGAEKAYQDGAEYNLVRAIQVQPEPHRKLELLDRWRKLYPRSNFRQERFQMSILAHQTLGRSREMQRTAMEMADDNPAGLGSYWVTAVGVTLRESSPAGLRVVEKAAKNLIAHSGTMFARGLRPDAVSEDAWNRERQRMDTVAHRALGWVALCRSEWADAETEFRLVLLRDGNDAEAWYWLGTSILAQQRARRDISAFYFLARAVMLNGPGELPAAERKLAKRNLEQVFAKRRGSVQGLDAVYERARRGGPIPAER